MDRLVFDAPEIVTLNPEQVARWVGECVVA